MSDDKGGGSGSRFKILFLSYFYPPDLSAGSFRAEALVRALRTLPRHDLQIEMITTQPNRYRSFMREARLFESFDGLDVRRVPLPVGRGGFFGQAWAFLNFAKAVWGLVKTGEYDLVIATSSRLMTASLGAMVARRKSARLYLDIRDIFVETLGGVFRPIIWRPLLWAFGFLERWTLRRADRINLVSRGFLPYFKARYPSARYSFFSNGVDVEFAGGLAGNREAAEPSHRLHIVYAGNIGDGQGLHMVLPGLAQGLAEKAHFTVIGDGNRAQQLRKELLRLNVDNVDLLPPISRKELLGYYAAADVLFLHLNDMPAFRRVLPSKIFEYAATGKPILAGVTGYPAQFIREEITNVAIFAPCNPLAAARSLELLKLESADRAGFVQRYARENIMQHMAEDIAGCLKDA